METMVRAATLNGFASVAKSLGLAPHALLREQGLDANALLDNELRLPASVTCRLLERAAEQSGCDSFGLRMADHRHALDFGLVGVLLAHKRNLHDLWLAAIQYRHLVNDALVLSLEPDAALTVLRHELMVPEGTVTQQASDPATGVIVHGCRAVLGDAWQPRQISFRRPAPRDLSAHRRAFTCPLVFGSEENAVLMNTADLDRPNPAADPDLVRYAESLARPLAVAQPEQFAHDVRRAIHLLLPVEQARVEDVAAVCHVSVRTLQRQLGEQGLSFSELVDEVRRQLAERYLRNPRFAMGQVALLLGYTRQASFTRWFAQQFGCTPTEWRKRLV